MRVQPGLANGTDRRFTKLEPLLDVSSQCSRQLQPVRVRRFQRCRCQKESFSQQILFHFTDLMSYHICWFCGTALQVCKSFHHPRGRNLPPPNAHPAKTVSRESEYTCGHREFLDDSILVSSPICANCSAGVCPPEYFTLIWKPRALTLMHSGNRRKTLFTAFQTHYSHWGW